MGARPGRLWGLLGSTALFGLTLGAGSCRPDKDLIAPLEYLADDPDEAQSGGTTTIFDFSQNAFNHRAPGVVGAEATLFSVGNSFFRTNWVAAPASTPEIDGLGPLLNARSCSGCHNLDGRGRPPLPGEVGLTSMLMRLSQPGQNVHGGPVPDPTYGEQLSNRAIPGVAPEGDVAVTYTERPGTYPDGTAYSLRQPTYAFTNLGYGPLAPGGLTSPRVGQQLCGLGLLEAVPEATLLAAADPLDLNGDGISGRPNYVWDEAAARPVVGRFGWKANQPNLRQQTGAAFVGDMGLTSSLFPVDNCTSPQLDCQQAYNGNTSPTEPYELTPRVFDMVSFYVATLAVPGRRRVQDSAVKRGKMLFVQLNCGGCHTPKTRTGATAVSAALANQTIRPYTDLLLHDMGPALADGRPDFEATGQEWRTPPLWGVGLFQTVSGHTFYLHDGRARSLEEAILWHGGEAQRARDGFTQLPAADRAALVQFLNSL